jgi:hypothetical protein
VIRTADLAEVDGAEHDGLFIAQEHHAECEQRFADSDGGFDESSAQRCADGWRDISTKGRNLNGESLNRKQGEKEERFHHA